MTKELFIQRIEEYYGIKYRSGVQLETILNYLSTKGGLFLSALYAELLKNFSGQYGRLPDVAVFEDLKVLASNKAQEIQREQQKNLPQLTDNTEPEEDRREDVIQMFKNLTEQQRRKQA